MHTHRITLKRLTHSLFTILTLINTTTARLTFTEIRNAQARWATEHPPIQEGTWLDATAGWMLIHSRTLHNLRFFSPFITNEDLSLPISPAQSLIRNFSRDQALSAQDFLSLEDRHSLLPLNPPACQYLSDFYHALLFLFPSYNGNISISTKTDFYPVKRSLHKEISQREYRSKDLLCNRKNSHRKQKFSPNDGIFLDLLIGKSKSKSKDALIECAANEIINLHCHSDSYKTKLWNAGHAAFQNAILHFHNSFNQLTTSPPSSTTALSPERSHFENINHLLSAFHLDFLSSEDEYLLFITLIHEKVSEIKKNEQRDSSHSVILTATILHEYLFNAPSHSSDQPCYFNAQQHSFLESLKGESLKGKSLKDEANLISLAETLLPRVSPAASTFLLIQPIKVQREDAEIIGILLQLASFFAFDSARGGHAAQHLPRSALLNKAFCNRFHNPHVFSKQVFKFFKTQIYAAMDASPSPGNLQTSNGILTRSAKNFFLLFQYFWPSKKDILSLEELSEDQNGFTVDTTAWANSMSTAFQGHLPERKYSVHCHCITTKEPNNEDPTKEQFSHVYIVLYSHATHTIELIFTFSPTQASLKIQEKSKDIAAIKNLKDQNSQKQPLSQSNRLPKKIPSEVLHSEEFPNTFKLLYKLYWKRHSLPAVADLSYQSLIKTLSGYSLVSPTAHWQWLQALYGGLAGNAGQRVYNNILSYNTFAETEVTQSLVKDIGISLSSLRELRPLLVAENLSNSSFLIFELLRDSSQVLPMKTYLHLLEILDKKSSFKMVVYLENLKDWGGVFECPLLTAVLQDVISEAIQAGSADVLKFIFDKLLETAGKSFDWICNARTLLSFYLRSMTEGEVIQLICKAQGDALLWKFIVDAKLSTRADFLKNADLLLYFSKADLQQYLTLVFNKFFDRQKDSKRMKGISEIGVLSRVLKKRVKVSAERMGVFTESDYLEFMKMVSSSEGEIQSLIGEGEFE